MLKKWNNSSKKKWKIHPKQTPSDFGRRLLDLAPHGHFVWIPCFLPPHCPWPFPDAWSHPSGTSSRLHLDTLRSFPASRAATSVPAFCTTSTTSTAAPTTLSPPLPFPSLPPTGCPLPSGALSSARFGRAAPPLRHAARLSSHSVECPTTLLTPSSIATTLFVRAAPPAKNPAESGSPNPRGSSFVPTCPPQARPYLTCSFHSWRSLLLLARDRPSVPHNHACTTFSAHFLQVTSQPLMRALQDDCQRYVDETLSHAGRAHIDQSMV